MAHSKEKKINDDSIVHIRDFMDHETRISMVEGAIIDIRENFKEIKETFKEIDKKFDAMRDRMDSHFKWILATIAIPLATGIILRIIHVI